MFRQLRVFRYIVGHLPKVTLNSWLALVENPTSSLLGYHALVSFCLSFLFLGVLSVFDVFTLMSMSLGRASETRNTNKHTEQECLFTSNMGSIIDVHVCSDP